MHIIHVTQILNIARTGVDTAGKLYLFLKSGIEFFPPYSITMKNACQILLIANEKP